MWLILLKYRKSKFIYFPSDVALLSIGGHYYTVRRSPSVCLAQYSDSSAYCLIKANGKPKSRKIILDTADA